MESHHENQNMPEWRQSLLSTPETELCSTQAELIRILIAPQQPPYDSEPPLVTFRSQAGTIKYIWPITQPISDMGAQRKRMTELRRRLGWKIMGGACDVLECYAE